MPVVGKPLALGRVHEPCLFSRRYLLTHAAALYPQPFRRIRYYDADIDKRYVFLTNNFTLPALPLRAHSLCS